jgi:hypothetical protein
MVLSLDLPFSESTKPNVYFPSRFPSIVQVLANVSSVCAVRISSQSFVREVEYESDVMGGNLSEASGMDKLVAFLTRDPTLQV